MREHAPQAKVVLASSASVYGPFVGSNLFTEDRQLAPASIYAATKAAAEHLCSTYKLSYGIDTRIVRFANVYGPRQNQYVVFDLCRRIAIAEQEVTILGNGFERRDFIHVRDAVKSILEVGLRVDLAWDLFNVATGRTTNILKLAQMISQEMAKADIQFLPTKKSWIGDLPVLSCSAARIQSVLGYEFEDISKGIVHYVKWFTQQNHSQVRQEVFALCK